MATSSKNYILARRRAGIADLTAVTPTNGEYTLDEAEASGIYRINCTHQVGIATATEVGLSSDRFPYRVVMNNAARKANAVDTVIHYWPVMTIAGKPLTFQRKPLASDLAVKNLYAWFTDLDDMLWNVWDALRDEVLVTAADEDITKLVEEVYLILILINPTDAQKADAIAKIAELLEKFMDKKMLPFLKISTDCVMVGRPHGVAYSALGTVSANRVALNEAALTMYVNYNRLKVKYDQVQDGTVAAAAYSIASMFRFGLVESHEHQEYVTLFVDPDDKDPSKFNITEVECPKGMTVPANLSIGQAIDMSTVKVKKTLVEFGNLLVCSAGLMHYLFNHTTGGTEMTGTLITSLAMYKFIHADTSRESVETITSLFYEALHPVNKRAIANIFFKNARVTTYGRMRGSPMCEKLQMDSFMSIRSNPYPAGSHKAFICLTALRRVLEAGLGPFLPWAESLSACIATCKGILTNGARSHIGSAYYTGEPPVVQPASLDLYLPELAVYVNTFNKGDSLSMSPHLSVEIAQRSSMNWASLMKDLKANDVSATSVEVVRTFLSTSGTVHFAFDPADQSTWAKASETSTVALKTITEVFN